MQRVTMILAYKFSLFKRFKELELVVKVPLSSWHVSRVLLDERKDGGVWTGGGSNTLNNYSTELN